MAEFPALSLKNLQAVILDWAGTTVDYGCRGPARVFVESFAVHGLNVTEAEAREPMGMNKLDHVAAMLAMPRIGQLWTKLHGSPPDAAAAELVYGHVQQSMLDVIARYSIPIPGAVAGVSVMRAAGLRIGSCTGYPRPVAEKMAERAALAGFSPDCLLCATDVAKGRPAPDMCLEILRRFSISNPWRAVKIGDTVQDILEGRSAGMWTIGITLTGSLVGLSEEELAALSPARREAVVEKAGRDLTLAGADFLAPDIPSCLPLLERIDAMARQPHA